MVFTAGKYGFLSDRNHVSASERFTRTLAMQWYLYFCFPLIFSYGFYHLENLILCVLTDLFIIAGSIEKRTRIECEFGIF